MLPNRNGAKLAEITKSKRQLWLEIALVLGLSLGSSAVYSLIAIIRRVLDTTPLGEQGTSIINPIVSSPIFDAIYQVLSVAFALIPVALAIYLLSLDGVNPFKRIGLDFSRFGKDVLSGLALAAIIGIPGIGLYFLGRMLGITVSITTSTLDFNVWSIIVMLLVALRAALSEEVIGVGFLFTRAEEATEFPSSWKLWTLIILISAFRGSYHLYQGFGPFFGNMAMGVVFLLYFICYRRVLPLVVAHFTINSIAFIAAPFALEMLS
ncbi:MAG: CPBP family intramembrane metalloprotease [Microbacteriaceae bacterium]|nr:CPBP family intramembrane metalloprotease [Microbacteriaceae bacterium]